MQVTFQLTHKLFLLLGVQMGFKPKILKFCLHGSLECANNCVRTV